ncbi:helix-turn-helix domain-containing protein [Streptomyces antarcticus]|uniref:helix-turn-helix domain-containing protein n=1 Tax=Streptomyces antarcticus TaxID=2996458 RepID=UPI002270820E|nr:MULTISPECIES: helix-turn-helix transcriptional regulator [unclassified Streptomyces]MCY0942908.1 helix-turn-helix transcriptional regulator [Streptomyces sp. H34-AA3]MCY0953045.1 helix-turn-helix transcriptional regulator [Streptomyces sp. H27-S2]MCZ4083132.1 helix-turn-helix transcriptional regulator [Streptomyces sp. H34-S5]
MRANLGQELTIDDMARIAMFSKFHFTRVFRDVTGTSPGRFLSALRLQEAKRLLVETQFSVADISSEVGYSSVGTFSSRFKLCVGVSPSMYRQLDGFVPEVGPGELPPLTSLTPRNTLRGRIRLTDEGSHGYCFVGLFPTPVPQGQPVRCTVLQGPGAFELRDVPAGTWYVLVHSVPYGFENQPSGTGDEDAVSVGRYGPVTAHADTLLMPAEITLRPLDALDPPVLTALLDLRTTAMQAVAS